MRPLPGQLPRPTAGFACEAWNAAPVAAENHGNSWAFRPPCAGSFLSDDIFHLAKIPRIPHFPSAVRSDLFPSKLKSLSFIVQFLQLVGHGVLQSSETGERRAGLSHCQFSSSQQLGAWGFLWDTGVDTYGEWRGRVCRGQKATHVHMTCKAHKKEPMWAKLRGEKSKRKAAGLGRK